MKIHIENTNLMIEGDPSSTLLENLLNHNIEIPNSCGGMGTCGTCRVFILNSETPLPPRNFIEEERAQDLKYENSERLCCQLMVSHNLKIKIP